MESEIRAVLLDAVGTLIYADPPVEQAYAEAGRRFGSPLAPEVVRRRFEAAFQRQEQIDGAGPGDPLRRAPTSEARERARWRAIVRDVFAANGQRADSLFHWLWDHFANPAHWGVYPDARAAWAPLRRRGLLGGVASNFDERLEAIWPGLGLPLPRERLFYSSQLGWAKPDPAFFSAIARRLALQPHQLLMVGDHPRSDYQGALAAGWRALLVDRGQRRPGPHVIRSLEELAARLA